MSRAEFSLFFVGLDVLFDENRRTSIRRMFGNMTFV